MLNNVSFILIIFSIFFDTLKTCSLSYGFKFPTIEESYNLCGAVIVGTVEKQQKAGLFRQKDIYLKNSVYYKGCGPSRVKITGYSSGARCSIYPPEENQEIIVFVCRNQRGEGWVLHRFAPYAGQFTANNTHLEKLEQISDRNSKCDFSSFMQEPCLKRS